MKHTGILLLAAAVLLTGCTEPQTDSEAPASAVTEAVTEEPETESAQSEETAQSGTKPKTSAAGTTSMETTVTAAGNKKTQDDPAVSEQDGIVIETEAPAQKQEPSETLPPFDFGEDGVIELPEIPLN